MKLAYVDICGFRGYQKSVRFEFSESFTIIDGRNGAGKSTIFDAVEFALTGTISKYLDAKASGESVENYLWWSGASIASLQRYVEVGFRNGDQIHAVRRTPRDSRSHSISDVHSLLVDRDRAPKSAIEQLCATTIIRDEHIARLSLDLEETKRFTLLHDAIGAIDADEWIARAQRLHSSASSRVKTAQDEVTTVNTAMLAARRQIDHARSTILGTSVIGGATTRLQATLHTTAQAEGLGDIARRRLAALAERMELLHDISRQAHDVARIREGVSTLKRAVDAAAEAHQSAQDEVEVRARAVGDTPVSSALSLQARQLEQLVTIGRALGRRDGQCPLCASEIDHERTGSTNVEVPPSPDELDHARSLPYIMPNDG